MMVSRSQATQRPQAPTAFPRVERSRFSVARRGVSPAGTGDEQTFRTPHRVVEPTSTTIRRRHTDLPEDRCSCVSQQETKTPSRGSMPFSGIRCIDRYALDCLPSAIRSQGFSPSQRFAPDAPSRLYFKPHPLVGFLGLQSFSHRSQPRCLSTSPCSPAIRCSMTLIGRTDCACDVRSAPPGEPDGMCSASPETLAPELCSDRASDTLTDG